MALMDRLKIKKNITLVFKNQAMRSKSSKWNQRYPNIYSYTHKPFNDSPGGLLEGKVVGHLSQEENKAILFRPRKDKYYFPCLFVIIDEDVILDYY
jgi:hypothetical protein